jgi:acetylornithine deacetylase/succinyl-diaminopimelate desuccinylase-like protein
MNPHPMPPTPPIPANLSAWLASNASALTDLLRALVRIPSVNNADGASARENEAAAVLSSFLSNYNIPTRTLAPPSDPTRANLVAELDSGRPGPTILFMSHTDVVPAGDPAAWTHPPFSGALADGRIWGRGAIDCKMLVAAQAFVLAAFAANGLPAQGRIRLIAAADEEAGGRLGFGWLAAEHPDLLQADLAICEGGGSTLGRLDDNPDSPTLVSVGCGEKGRYVVTFTARGSGGHASTPFNRANPLAILGRLLDRIAAWQPAPIPASPVFPCLATLSSEFKQGLEFKLQLEKTSTPAEYSSPTVREGSASYPERARALARNRNRIDSPDVPDPNSALESAIASLDATLPGFARSLRAQSRMTFTPTMLHAGEGPNVIPTEARLICDARLLPGQTRADLDAVIANLLADFDESYMSYKSHTTYSSLDSHSALRTPHSALSSETLSVSLAENAPPSACDIPSDLLSKFQSAASAACGRPLRAVPTWCTGATDAHWVRALGAPVYGFQFIPPCADPARAGIHCIDESIEPDALAQCAASLAYFCAIESFRF